MFSSIASFLVLFIPLYSSMSLSCTIFFQFKISLNTSCNLNLVAIKYS
jgi:hypothetical protein